MATSIIASIATLCGLGIFFGFVLAYAAKKFHVPVDPTIERILAKLPGANCGSCGKAGCMGFAQALLAGELDLHSCSVAATENKKDIAAILGLSLEEKAKKVSCLHCCGGNHAKDKFLYDGIKDCLAASLVLGGQKECAYGCLTYGTCVKACPFDAIEMTGEGFPRVIESKCTACGICVNVCPKGLYTLIPFEPEKAKIYVACTSNDSGKVVMSVCGVGCIACRRCEKACPHGAVAVIDNLARIDYDKCTGCLECAKVCPTKVIKVRGAQPSPSR
ncbi:electron transport complex protein RnfB [Candidatus Velamenicoccus archaeovorus]|uniref:Ion-translocating oxidoreductase complex subunit B n=1 Tax=Velamenicoccus archaeovorus TaxID=1930593 RepID=A0A410P681_VELA1|nr:RnfABCDGE type electron transport complex subunit B [Candidatus Velamenicoccus archaeovorus]QAT17581.1 electron transport complex protein RnfB [Candidatus Velamenicoccus archaeovorus]